jgi:dCMP deaminase
MRKDHLSWEDYFMGIAVLSSQRSKDAQTQVGACIVNRDQRVVGIGYNGLPFGCEDEDYPWEREGDFLNTKYPYVVHAEPNAILNSTQSLKNCTLYVTLFPCHECAKLIIQSGIKEVVYMEDKYNGSDSNLASKRMFTSSGVNFRKYQQIEVKLTAVTE